MAGNYDPFIFHVANLLANFLGPQSAQASQAPGVAPQPQGQQPIYENMRNQPQFAQDQLAQNLLGPLAHQQMVRDITAQNPLQGAGIAAVTPLYTLAKILAPQTMAQWGKTGPQDNTLMSQPSTEEIGRGFAGFGEGMGDFIKQYFGGK